MNCPVCQGPVAEPPTEPGRADPWPFCSSRCRDVDLGRWFEGVYKISRPLDPTESTDGGPVTDFEDFEGDGG